MNIVFVLFDNVTQLDFSGPVQFLSRLPGGEVHVVSKDGKAVTTDSGFSILPGGSFADCPQADIICVPGGFGTREAIADAAIVDFVRDQAKSASGLLKGKRATTHWGYTHLLPLFGATYEKARVVRDGNLVTAGGVTSGIDFALELIAMIGGEDVARTVQLALEYDPAPPFEGGTPDTAPEHILFNLRGRIYERTAKEMEDAIRALSV
jgi:cyclohexyl-isocyanide hydratase